jgi:putative endonuclease
MKTSYFVYIVECKDGTLYTGIAKDVQKRLYAHNHLKSGARYTSIRRPIKLKFFEKHKNFKNAIKREIEIKSWSKKRKLALFGKTK